jgi:hypothetical protein
MSEANSSCFILKDFSSLISNEGKYSQFYLLHAFGLTWVCFSPSIVAVFLAPTEVSCYMEEVVP